MPEVAINKNSQPFVAKYEIRPAGQIDRMPFALDSSSLEQCVNVSFWSGVLAANASH